jgi:hypothetical protein
VRVTDHARSPDGGAGAWLALLREPAENTTIVDPIRSSPEEKIFVYRFVDGAASGSRRFVEVRWDDDRIRVIVPPPWIGISDGRLTGSELLVRRYPLDGSLRASVAVLDPNFATLAALMMTSAMPKAAIFVDENADLIFAQRSLAGAAAAYVALSSGRVKSRLMENIRDFERSGTYPDCQAIAAWRMIRFPENNREVRSAILSAFRAGPPFFSFGVGWILDALTMLGPNDTEALACVDIVKRVAIRLDTRQIFTTVRG